MGTKDKIDEQGFVTNFAIVPGYKWICIAPGYMGGHPAIFGKRVSVQLVLDFVSQGLTLEEIAEDYDLPLEAVKETLKFAQESVEARMVG